MDTLLNYIDNMFTGIPDTEDTRRLKDDITANMCDKFEELTNRGKNVNEVVGIVISEFGNIDEVLAEMGIARTAAAPQKKNSTVKQFFRANSLRLLFPVPAYALVIYALTHIFENLYLDPVRGGINAFAAFAAAGIIMLISYIFGKRADKQRQPLTEEYRKALTAIYDCSLKISNIVCICSSLLIFLALSYILISLTSYESSYIDLISEGPPFVAAACYAMYILMRDMRMIINRKLDRACEKISGVKETILLFIPAFISAVCRFWHLLVNLDGGEEAIIDRMLRDFVPVTVAVFLITCSIAYYVDLFIEHRKHLFKM